MASSTASSAAADWHKPLLHPTLNGNGTYIDAVSPTLTSSTPPHDVPPAVDETLNSVKPLLATGSSRSISNDHDHLQRGRNSSLLSATLTLAIAAAGAGMLSFAYAVRVQGVLAAVVATLLFGSLNAFTLHIVAKLTHAYAHKMSGTSYEELVLVVLGPRAYAACLATIFIGGIGACTGFLMIMGDFSHQFLWDLCTKIDATTGQAIVNHCGIWSSRSMAIILLSAVIIAPLMFVRSLHSLSIATLLSFLTVISVCGVVITRCVQFLWHTSGADTSSDAAAIISDTNSTSSLFFNPSWRFLLGWPIIFFSLGCHLQVPPVYLELTTEAKTKMSSRVIPFQTLSVVLLYLFTGVSGYLLFGGDTKGNVLLNFPTDDVLVDIAKAAMALHITLAFPVCVFPCRLALEFLLTTYCNCSPASTMLSAVYSWGILVLSAALAIGIPQIQVVFGLLGATIAVSQCYLFPGLMMRKVVQEREQDAKDKLAVEKQSRFEKQMSTALIYWSVFVGILGTTATIISTFFD